MGTAGNVLPPVSNAVPGEAHDIEDQLHEGSSAIHDHPDGDLWLQSALVQVDGT